MAADRALTEVVLATGNAAKIAWLREGLGGLPSHVTIRAVDVAIDEDGPTCEANALLKARAIRPRNGSIVLAEDSGLHVAALNGFPGTHTARWHPGDDDDRATELLRIMRVVPSTERHAEFVSAVALCDAARVHVCVGRLAGLIAETLRGAIGDGYSRLFVPAGSTHTIAELGIDAVADNDHRRRALRRAAATLMTWSD